jgi:pilus assembly protein CpaF
VDKICEVLRERVLERIDWSKESDDDTLRELIGREIATTVEWEKISIKDRIMLEQRIYNSLRKLDILQDLIEDDRVTEIMVNGPDKIFYEKDGEVLEYPYHFPSEEKLQDVIQQIVGRNNRVVNLSSPIVDTRLEDGSRVNIVLSPISIDGSAISIRKFPQKPLDMEQLINLETITEEAAVFLKELVESGYNIFISGGTSSGKTTFLNALSSYIPEEERIITIEDSAELQLLHRKNLVRMETRNANMEGVTSIPIRRLIHTALRMNPDRIIVGECRGEEAIDMLQAMNTGHDGSLSTGHANSTGDMVKRLETMVLMGTEIPLAAVRQQIASAIDIFIHLEKMPDKKRKVIEIAEVVGMKEGEVTLLPLYRYDGLLVKTADLIHKEKLNRKPREEGKENGL